MGLFIVYKSNAAEASFLQSRWKKVNIVTPATFFDAFLSFEAAAQKKRRSEYRGRLTVTNMKVLSIFIEIKDAFLEIVERG